MAIKELAPWNDLRDDHSPIFGELIFGKRYSFVSVILLSFFIRPEDRALLESNPSAEVGG
jgi:hypothetical protein